MADIATLEEFASYLQTDVDTATANLLLLDLAQGLVTVEIGAQDPWPKVAKAVALEAAKRGYVNPDGLRSEAVGGTSASYAGSGVFLTYDERNWLHGWLNGPGGGTAGQPQGSFPDPPDWPDPPR